MQAAQNLSPFLLPYLLLPAAKLSLSTAFTLGILRATILFLGLEYACMYIHVLLWTLYKMGIQRFTAASIRCGVMYVCLLHTDRN